MSSRKGTKRTIIEIDPPAQDLRVLGQIERTLGNVSHKKVCGFCNFTHRARGTDSTSPVLTRQDHLTSSGLQGATARTSGSSSTRGTDTSVDGANGEPDATEVMSDRADARFMTSTGADSVGHDRSGGPNADAVSERAATGVTTSTGAHSRSNDPYEAPVSVGAKPAGDSPTPMTTLRK